MSNPFASFPGPTPTEIMAAEDDFNRFLAAGLELTDEFIRGYVSAGLLYALERSRVTMPPSDFAAAVARATQDHREIRDRMTHHANPDPAGG